MYEYIIYAASGPLHSTPMHEQTESLRRTKTKRRGGGVSADVRNVRAIASPEADRSGSARLDRDETATQTQELIWNARSRGLLSQTAQDF